MHMANTATSKKTADIATAEEKETLPVASIDWEADAGAGIEQADADSYAIPMLKVLQSLSPQCDPDDGIEGAKPGMLFNTVTNELYDGNEGISVLPCHFTHTFIEWVPRSAGGGYVAEYGPTDPVISTAQRSDGGRNVLPNGNELEDTRNHYCLMVVKDGDSISFDPFLMTFTVTQIPASKKWLTRIGNIRKRGKGGNLFNPPSFSHVYKITTVKRKNDQGTWYVPEVNMVGEVQDADLYMAAKDFYEKVKTGKVKERREDARDDGANKTASTSNDLPADDDIPF
jgi:hypothetical protein